MLKGKSAIITGGVRGIGRAIAEEFCKNGADVIIGFRSNQEAAEKTARELEAYGTRVLVVQGDVADPAYGEKLAATAKEAFGPRPLPATRKPCWPAPAAAVLRKWNCFSLKTSVKPQRHRDAEEKQRLVLEGQVTFWVRVEENASHCFFEALCVFVSLCLCGEVFRFTVPVARWTGWCDAG